MSDSQTKMAKINRFTRRELGEEEVYCFSAILCDNEIDRDQEKFSRQALEKLAELFIGKTGIFNHDPKGENQTARIFDAKVVSDPERKTADGEEYACLKAEAYMVRTDSNADLIREIDGGIKKEVSVGCAVSKEICSVCGRDRRSGGCVHRKGRVYNGRKCFYILSEPTDAYEWSFVAVPAQRGGHQEILRRGGLRRKDRRKRGHCRKALRRPETRNNQAVVSFGRQHTGRADKGGGHKNGAGGAFKNEAGAFNPLRRRKRAGA